MSKIGKKPITIPEGVEVIARDFEVSVKGPKGQKDIPLHPKVKVAVAGKEVTVSVTSPDNRRQKALWGTFRSLVAGAVQGVASGFEKRLEVIGVGYKAAISGTKLILNLGYSHPIEMEIPKGLEAKVEKNVIVIAGFDKQQVGQFTALIRSKRKPEPYKGKGIKYSDEVIRRKAGKVVKAVGS